MKYTVLAACLLVALAGCGDDDPVRPIVPSGPEPYPAATTPRSAVLRYELAWERRDSLMIDSVLAADYEGSSIDMTDASPTALEFTKSDERTIVTNMARDALLSEVHVLMADSSSWLVERVPSDPPGWMTVTPSTVQIFVVREMETYSGFSDCTFKVQPTTPVTPADTVWSVVRWAEVKLNF